MEIRFANKRITVDSVDELCGKTVYYRGYDGLRKVEIRNVKVDRWGDCNADIYDGCLIGRNYRLNYMYAVNADGTIDLPCAYCGAVHTYAEWPTEYDGRIICDDCFEQHTFVCIECGERHDTRRRMRGINLCRPCFDRYNGEKYVRPTDSMNVFRIEDAVEVYDAACGVYYCTKEYVDQHTFVCSLCGKRHHNGDGVTYSGKRMCTKCADEYAPVCPICHRRHRATNTFEVDGYSGVCARCYRTETMVCGKCGERHLSRNMNHVNDLDIYVCRDCRRNMFYCEHCGEYYSTKEAANAKKIFYVGGNVGGYACGVCAEIGAKACSDCGKLFWSYDVHETEDGCFCESCYRERYKFCSACGNRFRTTDVFLRRSGTADVQKLLRIQ